MAKLTESQVMEAVRDAVMPYSAYINDVILSRHARAGVGHPPRSSLTLRRLRALERKGLVKCMAGPDGLYGYLWSLTNAGRAILESRSAA